jgi:hypothetical protein
MPACRTCLSWHLSEVSMKQLSDCTVALERSTLSILIHLSHWITPHNVDACILEQKHILTIKPDPKLIHHIHIKYYTIIRINYLHKPKSPNKLKLLKIAKQDIPKVVSYLNLAWLIFLYCFSVSTTIKSHSHFAMYKELIDLNGIAVCYMFLLTNPSSDSIHQQLFSNHWIAFLWIHIL